MTNDDGGEDSPVVVYNAAIMFGVIVLSLVIGCLVACLSRKLEKSLSRAQNPNIIPNSQREDS
jgi:hypothetical protein